MPDVLSASLGTSCLSPIDRLACFESHHPNARLFKHASGTSAQFANDEDVLSMLVVPVPMVEVPVDVSGPRCLAGSRHRTVQTLAQPSQAKLAICSQGNQRRLLHAVYRTKPTSSFLSLPYSTGWAKSSEALCGTPVSNLLSHLQGMGCSLRPVLEA